MKIYLASSWRNRYQQDVVKALREVGFTVYDFKNLERNIDNSGIKKGFIE